MRKGLILGSILVVLSAFAVFSVFFPECCGLPERIYHSVVLRDKDFCATSTRFRARFSGGGRTPDGQAVGFTTVRASDCIEVTSEVDEKDSADEARNEFEKRIATAFRVVERGPKIDRHRQNVGDRAVLVTHTGNEDKAVVLVRHSGESRLFEIESVSLSHALAYEKPIENGYRYDSRGYIVVLSR
jgi:hypothetical protein